MARRATIERKTNETDIRLSIDLDGTGTYSVHTGIGFFDHMLDLLAKHGQFDFDLEAKGDLNVDFHHTVEDVGLCLGEAIDRALGDKADIRRFGFFLLPMQDALAEVALDLSGRPHLTFAGTIPTAKTGEFDNELVEEFFTAVVNAAKMTMHVTIRSGKNAHHVIEAVFKGFARALDVATSIDPRGTGVPSTKGTL